MANKNMVKMLSNIFYLQLSQYSCPPGIVRSWKWDISPIIKKESRANLNYAIIILNRPLIQKKTFMKEFWNDAKVRIIVDGGTLEWNSFLDTFHEKDRNDMKKADMVTGDFDSVTPEVLDEYEKQGCKIVHTPDQAHTDFTKALMELTNHCTESNIKLDHVVAVGQTSGRLDQIFGNVQTLFLARVKNIININTRLYIMADDSLSWLLEPGDHIISVPEVSWRHKSCWCSLVPVGQSCECVSTTGLRWNLDKQPLQFGEIVSTSNLFDGLDTVTVKCSHRLLWSMRLPSLLD